MKDEEISDRQFEMRSKKNKQKVVKQEVNEKVKYKKGDVIFVISDKHKHKERETYIMVEVKDNLLEVVKAKKGKTAGIRYKVKIENVYKALPIWILQFSPISKTQMKKSLHSLPVKSSVVLKWSVSIASVVSIWTIDMKRKHA